MADKLGSLRPIDTLCDVAAFINLVYVEEAINKLSPQMAERIRRLQKRVAATIDREMAAEGFAPDLATAQAYDAEVDPHNVD
jgi:hypothetical protein